MTDNTSLGECPCGEPATWYRSEPPPVLPSASGATSRVVRSIELDDVDENLCDGCYKGFTGSLDEAAPGWKRVDLLRRQTFAGEENQAAEYSDNSQVGPEEDW